MIPISYTSKLTDSLDDVIKGLSRQIEVNAKFFAAPVYDTVVLTTPWTGSAAVVGATSYFREYVNPNLAVNETLQVDVLNLNNGNSPSNDIGVLTDERIYGLGMGPDTYVGGKLLKGGISYRDIESLKK